MQHRKILRVPKDIQEVNIMDMTLRWFGEGFDSVSLELDPPDSRGKRRYYHII